MSIPYPFDQFAVVYIRPNVVENVFDQLFFRPNGIVPICTMRKDENKWKKRLGMAHLLKKAKIYFNAINEYGIVDIV